MQRLVTLFFLMLLFSAWGLKAQETPFRRGVNLTGWFQTPNVRQIQFTRYTKKDFEQIKSLGCDVIRLPINLHAMTNGAPNYRIDPLFFTFLDAAVDWAEELGLHLILDNHTFDPAVDTDPSVGVVLEKVWRQMAAHYKHRSRLIYYEILNEPHGISDQLWNSIQQSVVRAIRTVDTVHTIIVGPANWNSFSNLAAMPVYDDRNLIYTFHFYDPFLFTHQGAGWVASSWERLANVPFPYQANRMPPMPAAFRGTWYEWLFNNYAADGTVAKVKELIDIAVQFRNSRRVPVFCGEFGVYMPNSNEQDRVFWYKIVREHLEARGISWTIWDYHGGFGVFNRFGNDFFEHDLNVPLLEALGFNVPPQTPLIIRPDSIGFWIYRDFFEPRVFEASYNDGELDFYNDQQPQEGAFSIYWTNVPQYNTVTFDFRPDRDLSYLRERGYVLDLWVRGAGTPSAFDIRFVDTKTVLPDDLPWRSRVTIREDQLRWDGRWQRLRIPLWNFTEHGAWYSGTWYQPQGKFDWRAIDRLEMVAEHRALQNTQLWFDQIQITQPGAVTSVEEAAQFLSSVRVFPNPVQDWLMLTTSAEAPELIYALMDSRGAMVRSAPMRGEARIYVGDLPSGIYFLRLTDGKRTAFTYKVIKE